MSDRGPQDDGGRHDHADREHRSAEPDGGHDERNTIGTRDEHWTLEGLGWRRPGHGLWFQEPPTSGRVLEWRHAATPDPAGSVSPQPTPGAEAPAPDEPIELAGHWDPDTAINAGWDSPAPGEEGFA